MEGNTVYHCGDKDRVDLMKTGEKEGKASQIRRKGGGSGVDVN